MKNPDTRRKSAAIEILPRLRPKAAPGHAAGALSGGGPERDAVSGERERTAATDELILDDPEALAERLRADAPGIVDGSVCLTTRLECGRPEFPTLLNVSVVVTYRHRRRTVRLETYCGQSMAGGDPASNTTDTLVDAVLVTLHRHITELGLTVRAGAGQSAP